MPKRKTPEEKPEEQFKRFVKTAKELEVDETGAALEASFKRISKPSASQSPSPQRKAK
jgi:hypothetical protein